MPRRNRPPKNRRQSAENVARLREARQALMALPQTRDETPEYRERNDAVIAAEHDVPWWMR
jgi:hypothetical protein